MSKAIRSGIVKMSLMVMEIRWPCIHKTFIHKEVTFLSTCISYHSNKQHIGTMYVIGHFQTYHVLRQPDSIVHCCTLCHQSVILQHFITHVNDGLDVIYNHWVIHFIDQPKLLFHFLVPRGKKHLYLIDSIT